MPEETNMYDDSKDEWWLAYQKYRMNLEEELAKCESEKETGRLLKFVDELHTNDATCVIPLHGTPGWDTDPNKLYWVVLNEAEFSKMCKRYGFCETAFVEWEL